MAIIALFEERSVAFAPSLPTWIPREIETEGRRARIEEEVGVEEDDKLESRSTSKSLAADVWPVAKQNKRAGR